MYEFYVYKCVQVTRHLWSFQLFFQFAKFLWCHSFIFWGLTGSGVPHLISPRCLLVSGLRGLWSSRSSRFGSNTPGIVPWRFSVCKSCLSIGCSKIFLDIEGFLLVHPNSPICTGSKLAKSSPGCLTIIVFFSIIHPQSHPSGFYPIMDFACSSYV